MVETRPKRKRREDAATAEEEPTPRRARRDQEDSFYCGICLETHEIEGMRLGSCTDVYCRDSLLSYVRGIRSLPISCPGCALNFNIDNVLNLLAQFNDKRTLEFIGKLNNPSTGADTPPDKNCSNLCCAESVFVTGKRRCKSCQDKACATCGLEKHDDCPLDTLAKKNKWQTCPSCNYLIERSGGCNAVKCRCGANFCYNCGTKYQSSRGGSFTAACNCGQFENVPRLRLRSFDSPHTSVQQIIQRARELTTDGSVDEARSALERGTRLWQIQSNHMRSLFASIHRRLDAFNTDISDP